MLVISRRKGQVLTIGDDIEVIVTEVHRSSVKLGVRAPKDLLVLRKEAAEKAAEANVGEVGLVETSTPGRGSQPPAKGDLVLWRKQKYTVKAVYKWTIHLEGELNSVNVRCLRPIAEGGFEEARILKRA